MIKDDEEALISEPRLFERLGSCLKQANRPLFRIFAVDRLKKRSIKGMTDPVNAHREPLVQINFQQLVQFERRLLDLHQMIVTSGKLVR